MYKMECIIRIKYWFSIFSFYKNIDYEGIRRLFSKEAIEGKFKMKKIYIIINKDKCLALEIVLLVFSLFIINFVHLIFYTSMFATVLSNFCKIIMICGGIIVAPIILSRLNSKILLLFSIYVILLLLMACFFYENSKYFLQYTVMPFTACIVLCILVISIRNFEYMQFYLYQMSKILALISLIFLLGVILGYIHIVYVKYSMGFGYACMLPTIILILSKSDHEKIYNYICVAAYIMLIILYGSRGPLLGIFAAIAYSSYRKIFLKNYAFILVIILQITLVLYLKEIFSVLMNFAKNIDIYSRTIYLILNDSLHMSGRDVIWGTLVDEIIKNPLIIRGINAEYHIFNGYAHNIFIELYYQSGSVVGTLLSIIIIWAIFKNLLMKQLDNVGLLKLIFLFSSVPGLCFSGSLWTNYNFWIWIGLNINTIYEQMAVEGQK